MQPLKHIAIIEDDEDIRSLLNLSLGTLGDFEVVEYPLATEALQHMPQQALPQLLLLDVMMPKMSGLQFLPLFRQLPLGNTVCVVIMTAKASEGELSDVMQAGADFVVQKPFDPVLLPELLNQFWTLFHESKG